MQPFDNESRNLKFCLILALNLININVHFKQILFPSYSLHRRTTLSVRGLTGKIYFRGKRGGKGEAPYCRSMFHLFSATDQHSS